MNQGFKKQKKQFLAAAIVKSVVAGVSLGVLAAGIVLLALKLGSVDIHPAYYALIAFGVAALSGGALFLILRPDDRSTAKALDGEYALRERVQTMVAFRDAEGEMAELQRRDTEKRLDALPARKPQPKKLWQYVLIPVLAVALLFTAVFLPANSRPVDGVEDPPFHLTDTQIAALNQLIADVEGSDLQDSLKGGIAASLEDLKDVLGEAEVESEMQNAVIATVSLVHVLVNTANCYDEITVAMNAFETVIPLVSAVTDGVFYYRALSMKFASIEQVRSAKRDFADTIGAKVSPHMTAFRESFAGTQTDGLYETLHDAADAIELALTNSLVDEENTVYAALSAVKSELLSIAQMVNSGLYFDTFIQSALDEAFAKASETLTDALMPETYHLIMDEFVRLRLAQIFGIPENLLPAVGGNSQGNHPGKPGDGDGPGNGDDTDDERDTADGGYSSEQIKYGSDDMIYDHEIGALVPYGEYLSKYHARVQEQIKELMEKGAYSDELDEIINEYYEILRGGIKNEENNQ